MNKLINASQNLTMSSREIAELTGKRHDHVLSDIKTMLEQLYVSSPDFLGVLESSYIAANGKQNPQYLLDKDHSLCLVAGYSAVLRMRIIKRWQELEAKNNKPLTRKEMALMVIAQEEEIEKLQLENRYLGEKAEAAIDVANRIENCLTLQALVLTSRDEDRAELKAQYNRRRGNRK